MLLRKVSVSLDKQWKVGGFETASKNKLAVVRREPVGVVLAIAPFNYPVNLSGSKIAPALIAGNVVMFKPPTQGSISGLLLAKAFEEAGIPAGVSIPLQVVVQKLGIISLSTKKSTSSTLQVQLQSENVLVV